MYLNFIAVDGKVINLNAVAVIEDNSTEDKPVATVHMLQGDTFSFDGEDATGIFDRMDLIVAVNEAAMAQAAAASQGAQP